MRPDSRVRERSTLLLAAAAEWACRRRARDRIHLDVHRDNLRAQAAYRRAGFEPTGETFSGPIGPEIVMAGRCLSVAGRPERR